MAVLDTPTILEAVRDRINALAPSVQHSADDIFYVSLGTRLNVTGARQGLLRADAPIRKLTGGRTCHDWETTVYLDMFYPDIPAEPGQRGNFALALQDAEDILADLYQWSVTTSGILDMQPDPGFVDGEGDGFLVASRTIFIRYERSTS